MPSFLRSKPKREIAATALAIATAVAGGAWAVFTYFHAPSKEGAATAPTVQVGPGGVGAGGNISGSTIVIERPPATAPPARQ